MLKNKCFLFYLFILLQIALHAACYEHAYHWSILEALAAIFRRLKGGGFPYLGDSNASEWRNICANSRAL
jgi:hypothetical protein